MCVDVFLQRERERYTCEDVNANFVVFMAPVVSFLDIDDCVRVTCSFHGTCVDGVNSHTCSCEEGYTGDNCETGRFVVGRSGM